jgi:hypothetical protein
VTVCLDVEGRAGATPDLEVVGDVTHTAVVDQSHAIDALLGIVNVPMAVWIDEDLRIVRPAELASPPREDRPSSLPTEGMPERFVAMMTAASRINGDVAWYPDALRDWAANGSSSAFVLDADAVTANSGSRSFDEATAAAHFELGQHLHHAGDRAGSIEHFREAHRLHPTNWTYKRQAWELASRIDGPLARFWQGPLPGQEDTWPYDGDWVTDINALGPENYYPPRVT